MTEEERSGYEQHGQLGAHCGGQGPVRHLSSNIYRMYNQDGSIEITDAW